MLKQIMYFIAIVGIAYLIRFIIFKVASYKKGEKNDNDE